MANITYDQAVQIYNERAAKLQNGYQALDQGIHSFLRNTRKFAEKSSRSTEEAALQKLEKEL